MRRVSCENPASRGEDDVVARKVRQFPGQPKIISVFAGNIGGKMTEAGLVADPNEVRIPGSKALFLPPCCAKGL